MTITWRICSLATWPELIGVTLTVSLPSFTPLPARWQPCHLCSWLNTCEFFLLDLSPIMCLPPVPDHVGFCKNCRKRDYLLARNLITVSTKVQSVLAMWGACHWGWMDCRAQLNLFNCWESPACSSKIRHSNKSLSIPSTNPDLSDANNMWERCD